MPTRRPRWATLGDVLKAATRLQALIPTPGTRTSYRPGSATTYTAPTSAAAVDATNISIAGTYGPTGEAIIAASAYYEFSAATDLYLSLFNGGTQVSGTNSKVLRAVPAGTGFVVFTRFRVTGTAGAPFTLALGHLATTTGAAVLNCGPGFANVVLTAAPS